MDKMLGDNDILRALSRLYRVNGDEKYDYVHPDPYILVVEV